MPLTHADFDLASICSKPPKAIREAIEARELAKTAAQREAELKVALAAHALLAKANDDKQLPAAREMLAQAKAELDSVLEGKGSYSPIRGAKKALESPADKEADYPATYPMTSTGRRLALARWITSRENPLTARVAVNHVWMRHFGRPLVDSVFDFGLRAKPARACGTA